MLQEQYQRHLLRDHEIELVSGIRDVQPLVQYFEASLPEALLDKTGSPRKTTLAFVRWLQDAVTSNRDHYATLCYTLLKSGYITLFNLLLPAVDPEDLERTAMSIGGVSPSFGYDTPLEDFPDAAVANAEPMSEERKTLLEHHRALINSRLCTQEVLNYLCCYGYVSGTQRQSITIAAEGHRAATLLSVLLLSTNEAFDRFCFALLMTGQFSLYVRLRDQVDSVKLDEYSKQMHALVNNIDNIENECQMEELPAREETKFPQPHLLEITVDACDASSASELPYYHPDRVYKNFSLPKGLALIINNSRFATSPDRNGTDVDEMNIRQLLSKLGYNVLKTYENLTAKAMIDVGRRFAQDARHNSCHSCIVVVMTHGEYDKLNGSDDAKINIHDFVECFNAHAAPALAGKPKLFFIQACRGLRRDPGVRQEVPVDEADTPLLKSLFGRFRATNSLMSSSLSVQSSASLQPEHQIQKKLRRLPSNSDVLVAYSTPPNYVSWRNAVNGSWFIQSICEVFSKHAQSQSIESLLKMVQKRVSEVYESTPHNCKQVPEYTCRLSKDFYFFPKVSSE
ncbi:cell death protein CED-3 [Aphelenchoides avenae]|nr:cell death protein CED-3 [Aphelenchus avenae]